MICCLETVSWVSERDGPAEGGDDAHILCSADGAGQTPLAVPCEPVFSAAADLAHLCDEVGEELGVCGLDEGVDAEEVEGVVLAGLGGVGAEEGAPAADALVVGAVFEVGGLDELRRGEEGERGGAVGRGGRTFGMGVLRDLRGSLWMSTEGA